MALILLLAWLQAALAGERPAEQRLVVDVQGLRRTATLALPAGWDGQSTLPLLLAFHGAGRPSQAHRGRQLPRLTELEAEASARGVAVVFPDAWRGRWGDTRADSPAERRGVDDLAFVDALLRSLAARLPIGPVAAAGYSNGGMFSLRLGCARAGALVGVTSVAGSLPVSLACQPERPIFINLILNQSDPLVSFQGGSIPGHAGTLRAAEESAQILAAAVGCVEAPTPGPWLDAADDGTRARRRRWGGCPPGGGLTLWEIEGGGHTWPGARETALAPILGRTSQELDASAVALDLLAPPP